MAAARLVIVARVAWTSWSTRWPDVSEATHSRFANLQVFITRLYVGSGFLRHAVLVRASARLVLSNITRAPSRRFAPEASSHDEGYAGHIASGWTCGLGATTVASRRVATLFLIA